MSGGREVPIIGDEVSIPFTLMSSSSPMPMRHVAASYGSTDPWLAWQYVEREFGTGALKITPAHDQNDYAIGKRLGLPLINLLNKDGSLNENAGQYWCAPLSLQREMRDRWRCCQAEGMPSF